MVLLPHVIYAKLTKGVDYIIFKIKINLLLCIEYSKIEEKMSE